MLSETLNKCNFVFYEPTLSKEDFNLFYSNLIRHKDTAHFSIKSFFVFYYLYYYFLWNNLSLDIKTQWIEYSNSLCFKVSPRLCFIGQNISNCIDLYNAQQNDISIY